MSLAYRLGTVAFIMAMMALALYILTAGILGRRIHRKSLALFFICGEVIQWSAMFLYLLYTVVTGQEDMPSAVFDTAGYLLMALILGLMMSRLHHLPLLHTFTAAILCTFVVNTANNTMVYVVEEYSPLFDRQHFLAFVRLDVPYMLTVGVALLVAAILKRSGFYRYFAAMFRSRARGILTLAVCLALTLIMPLQQLLFPDLTPDANYATFFFALIVVGVFLLQFAAMYAAGQDRIKAQEETILQQQAHMALLEELQQEIRAFRHDFTNLFSGLTLQAQEGDLAGIQDFMKRTSSYFDEKLGSEIAGVLEALRPVNGQLSMDTDDLLRALGILLDNAIEAVPKWEGQVRVVLLQEEKELYLAVANNYEQAPDLSALAKKGYTTKGSGHGTGLTSYRRIVARCRGCATRTYLKDGMFIQELHIPAA